MTTQSKLGNLSQAEKTVNEKTGPQEKQPANAPAPDGEDQAEDKAEDNGNK